MGETATSPKPNLYKDKTRYYAEILNGLFDATSFMDQDRLFEFVCMLVRAGGMHGPGWDPWYESQAILDDLRVFMNWPLPVNEFPDPDRTRMRLALLSYCHITEVNMAYVLLANLLRLQLGQKYHINPFGDLTKRVTNKEGMVVNMVPPFPRQKIQRIKELAEKAKRPQIAEALNEIYDGTIRNAVYHSDYVLHEKAMHLMNSHRLSKQGFMTPVVPFDDLEELITSAFAFYSALFALYERCRRSFTDFKHCFVPYDLHYKGLLELVFDKEDRLVGFRVYWPNSTISEYSRIEDNSIAMNLKFDPDGSINMFVGMYASKPAVFSPLVEEGAEPHYSPRPGTEIQPHWPDPLVAYKLP